LQHLSLERGSLVQIYLPIADLPVNICNSGDGAGGRIHFRCSASAASDDAALDLPGFRRLSRWRASPVTLGILDVGTIVTAAPGYRRCALLHASPRLISTAFGVWLHHLRDRAA
jgi:hypothetical protein